MSIMEVKVACVSIYLQNLYKNLSRGDLIQLVKDEVQHQKNVTVSVYQVKLYVEKESTQKRRKSAHRQNILKLFPPHP